jgi:hypothetical protein
VNLRLTARVLRPADRAAIRLQEDAPRGGDRRAYLARPRGDRDARHHAAALDATAPGPLLGRVRRHHLVPPGCAARLTRTATSSSPPEARHDRPRSQRSDSLELVKNGLDAIVDEMAIALVRTAYSNNLKNAMDMSCALCDVDGRLIAQGLTLPLHLGSIPDAMAQVRRKFGASLEPDQRFLAIGPADHVEESVLVVGPLDPG